MKKIFLALALAATPALAQPAFVPITIDAGKLAQIQAFTRGLSMPAEAHDALARLWQGLEEDARREAAKNSHPAPTPPPEPPK